MSQASSIHSILAASPSPANKNPCCQRSHACSPISSPMRATVPAPYTDPPCLQYPPRALVLCPLLRQVSDSPPTRLCGIHFLSTSIFGSIHLVSVFRALDIYYIRCPCTTPYRFIFVSPPTARAIFNTCESFPISSLPQIGGHPRP